MADSVPGSTDGHLTNSQIVLLGSAISAKNMRKIATGYMDISNEVVRNIVDKNRDDQEGITRDVLEKWKNKPQNSDHNQIKKLASILYQAADENGYVDPVKIQQILQVSREELGLREAPIAEKELNELAEKLPTITEGRTNIDVVQWAENNTVKMEDLYTELKIDKLENEPMGVQSLAVNDYKELFTVGSGPRVKGKRVLGKGDPGNGKTTFSKKVAWDWTRGHLKDFSLVFLVSMKLVQQGDLIEDMILQQTPELEGLAVTQQKLRDILETFGSRCLVILDGYDEHLSRDNKPNEDVIKLLRGQKFLFCNVLLTSRSHSVAELEQYFSTIVSIQGFTEKHAREFASRVLIDKDKIDPIMEIQCLNAGEYIKEGNSVFTCPLLLLFLCILVNNDEIDLERKEVTLGEIYTRLVRCLYRKYTVRKGKVFKQSEFVEILKKVGKLADKNLYGKAFAQRSQILKQTGEDAFDYGFVIGHEDFRLSSNETCDILISFPHRTIQEFLAALYFILIHDDKDVETAIGEDQNFMKIPLILHFCLWFLGKYCTGKFFSFEDKDRTYGYLEAYVLVIIDRTVFNSNALLGVYSSFSVTAPRDKLVWDFFQKTLSKCRKVKHLSLSDRDPIGPLMEGIRPLLPQLLSITYLDGTRTYRLCSEELHIAFGPASMKHAGELLACCKGLEKPLYVSFVLRESTDLCKYLTANVSAVNIMRSVASVILADCLSRLSDIPCSPDLTRLYVVNNKLDENLALILSNVVERRNIPGLKLIGLRHCNIRGKLPLLFQNKWPGLTHLDLSKSPLDESDIQILGNIKVLLPNLTSLMLFLGHPSDDFVMTEGVSAHLLRRNETDKVRFVFPRHIALFDMFESPLPNMTELWMDSMNKHEYKKLVAAVNKGALPQLRILCITMWKYVNEHKMVDIVEGQMDGVTLLAQGHTLDWLPPVNAPKLTELTLNRFICSIFHLAMVTQSTVLTKLHKLDISHSSGMTGTLFILLCHSFPSLNSLILSDCGLNSQDLLSLAKANAKGRLPEVRLLDISRNDCIQGKLEDLFSCEAQWENLCLLNALNDSTQSFSSEGSPFCIHSYQPSNEIAISESVNFLFQPENRYRKNLQEFFVRCDRYSRTKILGEILDALERGLLPALKSVTVKTPADLSIVSMLRPSLVKLMANNVIETILLHTKQFLMPHFNLHLVALFEETKKKLMRGEPTDSLETLYEKATQRLDMSSVVSVAKSEGLTESKTKELIETVHTCLIREMTENVSARSSDRIGDFRKYGVDCRLITK